jgi:hypothetical protein
VWQLTVTSPWDGSEGVTEQFWVEHTLVEVGRSIERCLALEPDPTEIPAAL